MKPTLLVIVAALAIWSANCSDSPTQSNPPVDRSNLLLGRLAVAVPPGASQGIIIDAHSTNGAIETASFVIADGNIISATIADSVLTVTGLTVGKTAITVSTSSGKSRIVPVTVYDPLTMDCGELQFKYATTYNLDWYWDPEMQFYTPVPPPGYRSFGSIMTQYWPGPLAYSGMLTVKATDGSNALAEPIRYDRVYGWLYGGYGGPYFQYWRPIPPEGYKALSMVLATRLSAPAATSAICVREDLTVPGVVGPLSCYPSSFTEAFASWFVGAPTPGPSDSAYLAAGGVVLNRNAAPPTTDPVLNVLYVDLPLLVESEPQTIIPHLTGLLEPPTETKPLLQRAVMVPWNTVKDPVYTDPVWRAGNSPFYVLEREVYYKRLYHNYNSTSLVQENNVTITKGVISDSSSSYYNETAIEVSFEAGIALGKAEAKFKSTVSKKLGFSQQTSLAEFQMFSATTTIYTAPGKAAACWQKYNRITLYRHHGANREVVRTWEFGIDDSYITDEYPD